MQDDKYLKNAQILDRSRKNLKNYLERTILFYFLTFSYRNFILFNIIKDCGLIA